MLDEDQYAEVHRLYGECMNATKELREKWGLPPGAIGPKNGCYLWLCGTNIRPGWQVATTMQSCIIVCRSTVNHAPHAGNHCVHPKLSIAPSMALEASRPSPGIHPGGSGSESLRQILFESKLEISACLGTASACPVCGFSQSECSLLSLRSTQPCRRRWRSNFSRFIQALQVPVSRPQAWIERYLRVAAPE